ncbi:cyclic GMP-AMP synthase [Silurus asotus]|uniref:Cyclic GMP-AMP synthase n=1 Tax=Silurus asotus TaxID=30991 RepID=A0AAD5FHX7_SILAS|nr:cyclic GMP-AMP synthase [Silurus asotus]
MSARVNSRKVRDETPGASQPKSPRSTQRKSAPRNDEQEKEKASCSSKLAESQMVRSRNSLRDANPTGPPLTPKAAKGGEKKVASRCSTLRDTEENLSKDLQGAPEKAKKSQRPESAKASYASKFQENEKFSQSKSSMFIQSKEEAQPTRTAKNVEKKAATLSSASKTCTVDHNPTKVLQAALEKLKVKKSQRSESAKCVNDIQTKVTEHLKRHLDWCKDINVLKTGSYYENVKICEPDEFDVMMTIRVERVNLQPFSDNGAFYRVEMKRHTQRHPLEQFVNEDNTIMASKMLTDFREKVKEAVKALPYDVQVERKKPGCPAVTLLVKEKGKKIYIDFVLGLEVPSSWPEFTLYGFSIENWLSKKVKVDQRRKPFYLVPKYEGRGNAEQDGVMAKDAWRISFSHVEKYILKNHGNSKTCCEGEQKCCRKQCLKLLKYLLQRLKEKHPEEMDELCSYHAKTTLLHACAARVKDSVWAFSELSHCFQELLKDFEQNLRACKLPNFFIPSQNLLSGISKKKSKFIADLIENQRNNGFPILC